MNPLTFHDTTNLALEIEATPEGLPNLVQNPGGAKGAWFWLTPVASTTMSSNVTSLTFKTTPSQAANFTSDFMPLAASKWVSVAINIPAITTGHYLRATFDWYKADKTANGSSAQSTSWPGGSTFYHGNYQAPANTAYVKVRFNLYNGTGTANPAANADVTFNNAMVTWADTSAGIAKVRTNLCKNPSFETNASLWAGQGSTTVARSTAQAYTGFGYAGSASLALTSASAGTYTAVYLDDGSTVSMPVTGGAQYTASARLRSTVSRSARLRLRYVNAGGAALAEHVGPTVTTGTAGWQATLVTTASGPAPADATKAALYVDFLDCGASETHYIDGVCVEKTTVLNPIPFDGATVLSGHTYAWTGTAHASTSTDTTTNYDFKEPFTWRNIIGPTFEIGISRRGLDVGTLTALISDPQLDPAETADIRPGRQVRLMALNSGVWGSVFEGKASKAAVDYGTKPGDGPPRTTITLEAIDNTGTLANRLESRGVATVDALPYLLEGKGVPWDCNGSGNQVASAVVVSKNENASMLDQVAITRDSVLGYAWVGRSNVLNVWDSASLPATVSVIYSDVADADPAFDSYSAIDADFDTGRCINEVTVKWLRYSAATGTTEEILYGPYRDQASIDTWGPYSAEFTVHGATESAATIAAYAASILAANATPERRANSITVPVTDARSMKHATEVDLYSLVHVTYSDKVDEDYRVTGIAHTITPEKWLTTYSFDVTGSVAAPQVTPSPTVGRVDVGYAIRRLVTGTRTTNTTATASPYNIVTATIPYPINGVKYRVTAQTNVAIDTAAGWHEVQVKHGVSASTGGTQVGGAVVDHRVANRRQGATVLAEFTYTGTTGAANYNVVLVGEPNGGQGNAVAGSTNPSTLTVDEVG